MHNELASQISMFTDGVLSAQDDAGYPASVRTSVVVSGEALLVQLPGDVQIQAGPASLLFHDHDAQLWNQRVLVVRGELAAGPDGWAFRPLRLLPAMGDANGLALLRMVVGFRKVAKAYLRKRGLARPSVPWDKLKAVKAN